MGIYWNYKYSLYFYSSSPFFIKLIPISFSVGEGFKMADEAESGRGGEAFAGGKIKSKIIAEIKKAVPITKLLF